ncbi:phosphatase [Anaeromicropila populeti]|uniref:Putative hydrolase n=1 Tax=Anaeromicropila populeti TaxID=37658 RepID=A0A1I6KSI2_9FIRM|nr:phosphatase [Anaeromicropila populeti]SFR94189.1 putative hydrolase [Anaeromicropila populeti]
MKYLIDSHTHTIASGHAYSTLHEMIEMAQKKELPILSVTEHAPSMPGTCHAFYFENLRIIPRKYDSFTLLLGAEANIIDYNGTIDIYDDLARRLDIVIASLHQPCFKAGTVEENTRAYLNAMKNPNINIIGHPDDSRIPVDYEKLVQGAKASHVLLEVNNSSIAPTSFRSNSRENIKTYLTLCKELSVPIMLGSDAHICYDIANFKYAEEVIEEVNFPVQLIANCNMDLIKEYLTNVPEGIFQ